MRLGTHRHQRPDSSAGHLTPSLGAEQHHQRLMNRAAKLNRAAGLGQPHLHPGRTQPLDNIVELIGLKCSLVLSHHDRIKCPVRRLSRRQ